VHKKKKEEEEKEEEEEEEKGKSRLPWTAAMSGWRWKQRRPVVN
jgi:hypothetical protein